MILSKEEIPAWKSKILQWVSEQNYLYWLDSCMEREAYELAEYELLVGIGCKSELSVQYNEKVDWDSVNAFTQANEWKFFSLSYDLKNSIVNINSSNPDALKWPVISIIVPEIVITIHRDGRLKVEGISLDQLLDELDVQEQSQEVLKTEYSRTIDSFTKDEHHHKVEEIKQHIAQGNMYEMNLCMEFLLKDFYCSNPMALYQKLIEASPTPFSCYVRNEKDHILCASPERYLKRTNNRLYSQPIKGTSSRFDDPTKDKHSQMHLLNSLKERAEHIMIVDLVRNDISRISHTGSVQVDELFGIYGYRQVYQMISTISGKLEENKSFVDCLMATYPMGSMTGAPKFIVMQFIDALETAARGMYSGSIGYIKPDGDFDSNVVIRSLLIDEEKKLASYSVGGAITFDSDPDLEYQECLLKSKAIRSVITKD